MSETDLDPCHVMTIGGFQPPHIGHERVFDTMRGLGQHKFIMITKTSDDRHILSGLYRRSIIYEMIGGYDSGFDVNYSYNNAWDAIGYVRSTNQNIEHLKIVVGSDRVQSIMDVATRCNLSFHSPYKVIEVIEVPRGASAISSSLLRTLAKENMHNSFLNGMSKKLLLNTCEDIFRTYRRELNDRENGTR